MSTLSALVLPSSAQAVVSASTQLLQQVLYWLLQVRNTLYACLVPYVPLIPFGIVGNLAIIIAFASTKHGVGKTLRLYYIALAMAQLGTILSAHLVFFVDYGMRTLSNARLSLPVRYDTLACKLTKTCYFLSSYCENWIYVAINVEKAVSIARPFRARSLFTPQRARMTLALIVLTSTPVIALTVFVMDSLKNDYVNPICTGVNDSYPFVVMTWRLYVLLAVELIPPLTSLALTLYVIKRLREAAVRLTNVVCYITGREDRQRKERQATVTVAIMSLIHCAFFIPLGLITVYDLVVHLFTTDFLLAFQTFVAIMGMTAFAIIPETTNAIVYYFRVPAFRKFITSCFRRK